MCRICPSSDMIHQHEEKSHVEQQPSPPKTIKNRHRLLQLALKCNSLSPDRDTATLYSLTACAQPALSLSLALSPSLSSLSHTHIHIHTCKGTSTLHHQISTYPQPSLGYNSAPAPCSLRASSYWPGRPINQGGKEPFQVFPFPKADWCYYGSVRCHFGCRQGSGGGVGGGKHSAEHGLAGRSPANDFYAARQGMLGYAKAA